MFVNAGLYIFVQIARNTGIKIIAIVILASTKFQKKMFNLRKHTEKKNDRKGL